ncbi:MAG TPA: phage tail protein [Thermoanaerobaculia bacterium]
MEPERFLAAPSRISRYLEELPALYSQGPESHLLGRFLLAFEQVFTGLGDPQEPGLEEMVDGIGRHFDPASAPEDFLDWLAGWVALSLRPDWDVDTRRRILAEIVPAYRWRGTPAGLKRVLKAFTGLEPRIQEQFGALRVGESVVGETTLVGGGPPHYFAVEVFLPASAVKDLAREEAKLRAVIEAEKPAHTVYDLRIQIPTMQIGVHSTVGVDTILGNVAGDPAKPD